jgi:hypothetical protein
MMVADICLRASRAWRFERIVKRFDLISFAALADWLAREPGHIERDEARRMQALVDLRDSIGLGEFGRPDKPCVAYLPDIIPADRRGRFPLRLTVGQIEMMRAWNADLGADLWAPRTLCARWLQARALAPPPWLAHAPAASAARRGRHRGGRPSTVAVVVAPWFAALSKQELAASDVSLAATFIEAHPNFPGDEGTVRKVIGKLRNG